MEDLEQAIKDELLETQNELKRYKGIYGRFKLLSMFVRGTAFVFLAVGILAPLLSTVFESLDEQPMIPLGYISLVISGLAIVAEDVFSISKTRITSLSAMNGIQFHGQMFSLTASMLRDDDTSPVKDKLKVVEAAMGRRHAIVRQETGDWIAANLEALAILRKQVNQAVSDSQNAKKP